MSPEGRHIEVVMERVSTGGTRHQAHFRRSALTPMTGQERMAKNRARKSLFAEQAAADRQQDTDRKRKQRELAKVSAPDPDHTFCSKCKRWRWNPRDDALWHCQTWPSNRLQWWLPDEKPDIGYSSGEDSDDRSRWDVDGMCIECHHRKTPIPVDVDDELVVERLQVAWEDFQQSPHCERERLERERLERERAAPHGQREFEVNIAGVTSLGLPTVTLPAAALPAEAAWLADALASGMVLQARIVDFWGGSSAFRRALCVWLERLGFDVTVTDDGVQIGVSCGYVASRATGLMFAARDEWRVVDVSDAVEEVWISLGNALLETGWVSDEYLEMQHVYMLAQLFYEHVSSLPHQPWDVHTQAFPSMSWPLVVGESDWIMKCICEALMAFVQRGRVSGSPERAFYVTDTVDGRCRGTHWISVAISMHWD